MSKQDFTFNQKVSLNIDPESSTHTLRELTDQGYKLQSVNDNLRSATNSMAEHYHALARQIERDCRKEFGSSFKALGENGTDKFVSADERDQKAIRKALGIFRVNVGKEITYLQQTKGWDKNKMPTACDSAIRKIYGAWENNFSLEVLETCSKLGKANSDRKNEQDEKIAGVGAQATAAEQGNALALTGNEDVDKVLVGIIEDAKALTERDSKTATSMLEAFSKRLSDTAARALVARAVGQ